MNKKYAVCIGNNYPGSNVELSGCVNDAKDWGALLTLAGYEVLSLIECDKATAVGALTDLVAKTGWGDRAVFTYSGHGTWVPDRNGDEPDGRDEAICMTDFMQGGLLLDDEIHRIFSGLKRGAGALYLSDSCFSGSVNRFAGHAVGRPRFVSPAVFTQLNEDQARGMEVKAATVPELATSLISGCTDREFSYDAWFEVNGNERPNGAFTRAAIDTYSPGQSLNTWFKRIRPGKLPSEDYPQSPVLSAASTYRKYTRAL